MKNNKEELIKLIQENPNLPIVFMVSNDELCDGFGYTVMEDFRVYKKEIYEFEKYSDYYYTDDKSDVEDYFYDLLSEEEEYKDLSDEEYEKEIEKYIEANIRHYTAIVIYVS